MNKLLKTVITLTAIGVAMKVVLKKKKIRLTVEDLVVDGSVAT